MTAPSTEELAPLELTIENFRGVQRARWAPEGLCALAGPNGSGKSSLLAGFLFMHYALKKSVRDAIKVSGDYAALLHFDAEDPRVKLSLADAHVTWSITIAFDGNGRVLAFGESVVCDGVEQDLNAITGLQSLGTVESQPRLDRVFAAKPEAQSAIDDFRARVRSVSVFPTWPIGSFRQRAWSESHDTSERLLYDASNIAAVLKTWQQREHRAKFDWVRAKLKSIHPRMIDDLDVKQESTSFVRCFPKGDSNRWIPLNAMSSGVLGTLFALVAVAGAPTGATLLFDEADNSLHPAAIRQLLDAVAERVDEQSLTVVFATHSPVVLDHFNDDPSSVWVCEAGRGVERLTEQLDPQWLQTFKLGTIYGSAFARQHPKRVAETAGDSYHPHPSEPPKERGES
ncbi:MAG: ATP-binding protein [Polyangiales bacterium]